MPGILECWNNNWKGIDVGDIKERRKLDTQQSEVDWRRIKLFYQGVDGRRNDAGLGMTENHIYSALEVRRMSDIVMDLRMETKNGEMKDNETARVECMDRSFTEVLWEERSGSASALPLLWLSSLA